MSITLTLGENQTSNIMDIAANIERISKTIRDGVTLVAVSKFHPAEAIMQAYNAGQRDFGESRVQELAQKVKDLPKDIRWHFIGHLQTNKVRALVPGVSLIHSIDSEHLLRYVNKEAARIGKVVDVLLQVYVAKEESKFGFDAEECLSLLTEDFLAEMQNVRICGVMAMATNTEDVDEIKSEFSAAKSIFDKLKSGIMSDKPYFKEISMGMSDDYVYAMEEGSTMIRIGSSIFGERQY